MNAISRNNNSITNREKNDILEKINWATINVEMMYDYPEIRKKFNKARIFEKLNSLPGKIKNNERIKDTYNLVMKRLDNDVNKNDYFDDLFIGLSLLFQGIKLFI
jgi:hypothetical protein